MSKELDHWLWITLWWSPDPDSDFGADRPAAIAALPGPWRNYKMCVTSSYLEGDPDPRGGADGSLGDALAAVHGGDLCTHTEAARFFSHRREAPCGRMATLVWLTAPAGRGT